MSTNKVLVFADNVVFPGGEVRKGPYYVTMKQGKIHKIAPASCEKCDRCDAIACYLLAPGFVDIHNHGLGGGDDVLEYWTNPDYTCAKSVASGTTSILASIMFPKDTNKVDSVIEQLEKTVGRKDIGAVIEGIHAEGPLISEFCRLPENSKQVNASEFEDLLMKMPNLKVMTVSPSLASKLDYKPTKMLHERNIVPALGHDKQAREAEIINALSTSRTAPCHITHMFNASKFDHRSPGLVNFGLLEDYPFMPAYENIVPPTIELIGDLVHAHPLAIKLALSSRNWENIAFVTNCIADKRRKDSVTFCGTEIKVDNDNNVVKRSDDNSLVGSCTTMLDIFKTLIDEFDVPVGKAFMMLSENPARIANLGNVGSIEVGKDANLLMFDSNYVLTKTYVDGRMVFRTSACRRKRVVSTESFDESFEN